MKLYLRYCSIILRSQMQFKASFFLTVLGQFLVSFSMFISLHFMFQRFNVVQGFSYNEVLLCFAVVLAAFSLAECFVRGFDAFSGIISNGEFDRIMVRPRNEIFQVLGSRIEFTRIGRLMQAIVIFFWAIPSSGVEWSPDKIITLVFMIIGGFCLFSGMFLIYASLCFFTLEGLEFINIFTDGGREFGKYPLKIYGEGVLRFFTYIIPMALVQYYPLMYLTGKSNNEYLILFPLAGILFIFPCYLFWRFGLSHYKSTGS